MSRLDSLLLRGFARVLSATGGGVDLTHGAVTKKCLPATQPTAREARETGRWKKGTVVVELTRADFTALAVAHNQYVTYGGAKKKLVLIDDEDLLDPCVRLTLEPYQ